MGINLKISRCNSRLWEVYSFFGVGTRLRTGEVNPLFGFDGGAIGTAVGESLEKVDGGKKRSLLEIVGDSLVLGGVSKGLNFVAHTAITFDAYYWMGTVLNKEYL